MDQICISPSDPSSWLPAALSVLFSVILPRVILLALDTAGKRSPRAKGAAKAMRRAVVGKVDEQ